MMNIAIDKAQIADVCRRHPIRRLALFGSVIRADFRPTSDVDVLVEFEPGQTPGFGFFTIQQELSEILGKPADLNTPGCLSKYYRNEVLAEAEWIDEQT